MATNIQSLRKKRDATEKRLAHWEQALVHAAKKLKEYRRKERLYTTLIEKALDEKKKHNPKDPTRVVEV